MHAVPLCLTMKLGPEGEADYRHQGLTGIPGDIPSDAKRVFLNHNSIRRVRTYVFRWVCGDTKSNGQIYSDQDQLEKLSADTFCGLVRKILKQIHGASKMETFSWPILFSSRGRLGLGGGGFCLVRNLRARLYRSHLKYWRIQREDQGWIEDCL